MINFKDFDSNLLKIGKTSYKKNWYLYIGYITMKDSNYLKIKTVNTLFSIIDNVHIYIEKKMKVNI